MINFIYTCSMCKGRFSRKGNAFRHNLSLHDDLATIRRELNSTMIEQQNKKKTMQKNFTKRFRHIHKNQETKDNLDEIFFNTITNNLTYQNDTKISRIINQLIKPYLAIQAELNDTNPKDIPSILSTVLVSSLSSYNPVKSLYEAADYYRSMRGLAIMSKNLSLSTGISIELATENIKYAIRNSLLYKRINN